MTHGERMVWAAEFVRLMHEHRHEPPRLRSATAASGAAEMVDALHVIERSDLHHGGRCKLDDMLGVTR